MIRRGTWILVVIFLAVLAGAIVWTRRSESSAEEALPTPEPLWSYEATQVDGLRIEDLHSGEVVEVRRDPELAWKMIQPDEGPADAGRVEQAVTWVRQPDVSRILSGQRDLLPFGLADPGIRVTLLLKDGSTKAFDVGGAVGIGGKTYVRAVGGDDIQVVSQYSLDDVVSMLDNVPVLPPTSTPEVPLTSQTATPGTPSP